MNAVRHLPFAPCRSALLLAGLVLFAGTLRAASVSWALVNTQAYGGDLSPSTEKAATAYMAYFCSVSTAQTLFGGDGSIVSVTDYLKSNFATGLGKLAKDGTPLKEGDYDLGQYTFADHALSSASAGDYLAIVAYENGDDKAVRVFRNEALEGNVVFDDLPGLAGGSAGDWTVAAVPEPASGLMVLFGLAGAAFRRKKKIFQFAHLRDSAK